MAPEAGSEPAIAAAPPASAGSGLHLLLDLDEAASETLKREISRLLSPVRRPVTRRLRQVFWDTEQHHISLSGLALGLQTIGQRRQQICRAIFPLPGGGRVLVQREGSLDGDTLDVTRLALMPGADPALTAALGSAALVPVIGIDLVRTIWRVGFEGAEILVTLERAAIEASAGRKETIQLELRIAAGSPDALYAVARLLLTRIRFRLAGADPVQLGLAAVGIPVAPPDCTLDPAMSVRGGFLAIGRSAAEAVRSSIAALDHDLGVEAVHEARVALRRLRSILTVFKPVLPNLPSRQLGQALGDFAKLLGEAREWDVWLEETVAPLTAALAEPHSVLDDLADAATAERQLAAIAIGHATRSPDYVLLSLTLGAWFDAGIWPEPPTDAQEAALSGRLDAFARDLLRRRHRRLIRAAEGLKDAPPEHLHALRIEAKKLRYAAEFLRELFPVKPTRRYLAALKTIQEILGAANDAVVARNLVPHLTTGDTAALARASGLVAGWTAAEATAAKRRFGEAWGQFLETKRFWRG